MKHNATIRCDPAFRNAMKKSKKKEPESEKTKADVPKPLGSVTVTFMRDEDGIYAMMDGRRIPVSGYSFQEVSEGQSWRCMVDTKDRYKPELIPMEMVSERTEIEEPVIEMDSELEEEEPIVEVPAPSAEMERLRTENEELKKANSDLRRKLREAEGYKDLCSDKDRNISKLNRTVRSLSDQVNNLNKKVSEKNIGSLETKIEDLENGIESRNKEIEMLREKVKSLGGDLKTIPHLPPVMKAIKNGSTLRFMNSVEDGRYRVYVSPRNHRLKIVPDANGTVSCTKGEIRLPCIDMPSIGGETGPRQVGIVATGDGYEVSLVPS